MKKSVYAVILLSILLLGGISAFASDNAIESRAITVMNVAGEVYFSTGGRAEFPAKAGVTLRAGFCVRTGGDGEVYLVIDDDKLIKLAPNSALIISQADSKLVITVSAGELVFNVTQKQPEGSVEILSGGVSMGIRGTSGYLKRVKHALESAIECGLFDGEVVLQSQKLIVLIEAMEVDSIPAGDTKALTPDNGSLFALLSAVDERLEIDLPDDFMTDEDVQLLARLWEEALADENAPDEDGARRYLSDAEIVMLARDAIELVEYAPQPYTSTEPDLKKYVKELLAPIAETYNVTTWINTKKLTPPQNGDANSPNGASGAYEFSVTVMRNTFSGDTAPRAIEITPNPYSGTPNSERVRIYKAMVEDMEIPPLAQADAADEASIQAYIINNIAGALNDEYVRISLNCEWIKPVPGDASAPEGVNGSYTYTVTLARGWYSATTDEKVLVINAAPYEGEEAVDEYLTQALDALSRYSEEFTLHGDVPDIFAARDIAYSYLSDVFGAFEELEYYIIEDENERFTPAQNGTESAPGGVEGAYEFTLHLQKDAASVTSDIVRFRIIQKTYAETENERILNEYIERINGYQFGPLNKDDAPNEEAIIAYINNMTIDFFRIELRDEYVSGEIYRIRSTEPVPGDEYNNDGVPGEYVFMIALKRMGVYAYSDERTLNIFDPYGGVSNADILADYQTQLEGAEFFSPILQEDAISEDAIKRHIVSEVSAYLNGELEDTVVSVSASAAPGTLTPATAGDEANPSGTDGAYSCVIILSRGTASVEVVIGVAITATPKPPTTDAEILAAYSARIDNLQISPVPQANDSDAGNKAHIISAIENELNDTLVTVSINGLGMGYGAVAGDMFIPNGTNGLYGYPVRLTRGEEFVDLNVSLVITATPLHEDGMAVLMFADKVSDINIATIYAEEINSLISQLEMSVSVIEDAYPDEYPGTTYEIVPITEIPEGATDLTFEFCVAFTKGEYTANSERISVQVVFQ